MIRPYMTTDYYDLSQYIGQPLEIKKGAGIICQYRPPEEIKIVADYEKTVLVEMTFIKSEWGSKYNIPRTLMKLIPKSVLAIGDIILKVKSTGMFLTGEEITRYDMDAQAEPVLELIW